MIHPSYTELIQAINNNAEEDDNTMMLNSRYSLVLATSKRARQLIAGAEPLVNGAAGKKPLAIAIDELYKGKVKIVANSEEETEETASAASEEAVEETAETAAEETTEEETQEAVPAVSEETAETAEAVTEETNEENNQ